MYFQFIFVILDYVFALRAKEVIFEYVIPLLCAILSAFVGNCGTQYHFIQEVILFIGVLLGFSLAALTLLATSESIRSATMNYPSGRYVQSKGLSLYDFIIMSFSYLIIIETFLLVVYYVSLLFDIYVGNMVAKVANTVFVFVAVSIFFSTIKMVASLYFILIGTSRRQKDIKCK
jgi:hypothetical protein